jgi:hypothetical protein
MTKSPTRAFRLTLSLEADTRYDLVSALFDLATRAEREELTTGVSGGCGSGYIYELLHDPAQTHERYFAELKEALAKKRELPA